MNRYVNHRPHSRRVLGSRFVSWAARHRRPILVVGAAAAVVLLASTALLMIAGVRWPWLWYGLGLIHAGIVGGFVVLLIMSFIASDPEAIKHLRGSWGEENTRDVLGQAQRKKLIWGWVDSLMLQRGDLDHLVVTRSGGVVVVDSKWRSEITDHAQIIETARRVRLRSEGVVRTLLRSERGSHRARGHSVRVTPLVVMWGAAQCHLPDVVRTEGVEIVRGQGLLTWLQERSGEPVDKDAAADLLRQLKHFREQLATAQAGSNR